MAEQQERPGAFRRQIVDMLNRYRTTEAAVETPDKTPPGRKATRRTAARKSGRSGKRATVTPESDPGDDGS